MPKQTDKQSDTASVYLGADLRSKLEQAARDERRSLSQLIRMVLEDWLEARPAK